MLTASFTEESEQEGENHIFPHWFPFSNRNCSLWITKYYFILRTEHKIHYENIKYKSFLEETERNTTKLKTLSLGVEKKTGMMIIIVEVMTIFYNERNYFEGENSVLCGTHSIVHEDSENNYGVSSIWVGEETKNRNKKI